MAPKPDTTSTTLPRSPGPTQVRPKLKHEVLLSTTEWYRGRSILVTGGSGFMGKVLLEKLCRVLPDLHHVYVLIREKRGKTPAERLKAIIDLPIFDKLREHNPAAISILEAVDGDVTVPGLGLSETNKRKLLDNVSVVFHNAASLKLEAGLRDAITANTIGTKNLLDFCTEMSKLEACMHLSTAFCHVDVDCLEEKVYPTPDSPDDVFRMLRVLDEKAIEKITPEILGPHPNSYTFSKRLAETVVSEYASRLPVAILRPSIVIPALHEPFPGWVDSLNGPVGVLVGAGKGVIRTMLCNGGNHAEVAPVDIAINAMIALAWYRGTHCFTSIPVYNMTQSDLIRITWGEVLEKGKKVIRDQPFDWPLWYPGGNIRTNKFVHYTIIFFAHLLPAYFIDFLLFCFMQKRFMVRIQKRISVGLEVLQYFTMREWKFNNEVFLSVALEMTEKDLEIFYMANAKYDIDEYMQTAILGSRKYCMKESLTNLSRARRYSLFLYILDQTCWMLFYTWVCYKILYWANLIHYLNPANWTFGGSSLQSIQMLGE